jgi:hypothetical protein
MRSSLSVRDLAEWLVPLTANAEVATVLGSRPASSDTVESEGLLYAPVSGDGSPLLVPYFRWWLLCS